MRTPWKLCFFEPVFCLISTFSLLHTPTDIIVVLVKHMQSFICSRMIFILIVIIVQRYQLGEE